MKFQVSSIKFQEGRLEAERQREAPRQPKGVRTPTFVVPPSGGIERYADGETKKCASARNFVNPSSRHSRRLKAELQTGVPCKPKGVRTLTFVVPPSGGKDEVRANQNANENKFHSLETSNLKLQTLLSFALALPVLASAAPAPSAPGAAPEDIRPIRGAVEIPPPPESPWPTVLAVAGGILALALLVALAVWLKRRAEARRIPNLRQKAEKALEDARKLMTPEHSRDYSIAVSDIVRSFIEGVFKLPSTRRTTEEFLAELSAGNIVNLGPYQETLDRFLHLCDLGKFAGYRLSEEEMQNLHQAALDVIRCEPSTQKPK